MPSVNEPADVFKCYAIGSDDECWPFVGSAWGGKPSDRRPYFMAAGRRQIAYRWVYELVQGTTLTADQQILHSCDNGSYPIGCGNVRHMRVGTNRENVQDRIDKRRQGMADNVVRAIRKLLEEGRTQSDIAAMFGVSRETISAISTQRLYRHITD